MSAWSSIAKALTSFFRGGGGKVAASGAAEAAQAGTKVILTWGNTIKVAVVGCFSYLFLTGGLSNVVSTTLGIPEEVAQVIIIDHHRGVRSASRPGHPLSRELRTR